MALLDWLAMHWVAGVLLASYLAALLYNALQGRRASATMAGYYVGGRRFGGFAIGVSFLPRLRPPTATSVMRAKAMLTVCPGWLWLLCWCCSPTSHGVGSDPALGVWLRRLMR